MEFSLMLGVGYHREKALITMPLERRSGMRCNDGMAE